MTKIDSLRGRQTRQAYLAAMITTVIAAAGEEEARQEAPKGETTQPCPHPSGRVHKGLCMLCGHAVTKTKS